MQESEVSGAPSTSSFERRSTPSPGAREALHQLMASVIEAVSELLKLFTLECRVSAQAFSRMLALSLFAGLLLATLWALGLMAVAAAMRTFDTGWVSIAIILMLLTIGGLMITLVAVQRLSRQIGLSGTVEVLRQQ